MKPLLLSAALILAQIPVSAQQIVVPKGSPYGKLFQGDEKALKSAEQEKKVREALEQLLKRHDATPESSKSRVVCGMTVITPDLTIDPKMSVPRDPKDTTKYTIRVIPPAICK
jgi:hypothetical protein